MMAEVERQLVEACEAGMTMRAAQAEYFRTRSRDALVAAKVAESKFDTMVAAALRLARTKAEDQ